MPIRMRADDGTVQTFPDGTGPESARFAMTAYNNKDTWGGLAGKVGRAVNQTVQPDAPHPMFDPGRFKSYLASRDIGFLGGRHEFIRVVDTQTGKTLQSCDYGPTGPWFAPGDLSELKLTGTPTDVHDHLAWAARNDPQSPYKLQLTEIPASADSVIAACQAVDKRLAKGGIPYGAIPNPFNREANSNTAAREAANHAIQSENPGAPFLGPPSDPEHTPGWNIPLPAGGGQFPEQLRRGQTR